MQPSWMGWVGFVVLAAMISVTSCQVWDRDVPTGTESEATQ